MISYPEILKESDSREKINSNKNIKIVRNLWIIFLPLPFSYTLNQPLNPVNSTFSMSLNPNPCITLHWTNCTSIVLLTNDFPATSFPESNISCVHAARIVFLKEFIFPSLFKNIQVDSIWNKSKSLRKYSPILNI